MSIIISDAERVIQNAANKKDLHLPKAMLNDVPPFGSTFSGFGNIKCKKLKEYTKSSNFWNITLLR